MCQYGMLPCMDCVDLFGLVAREWQGVHVNGKEHSLVRHRWAAHIRIPSLPSDCNKLHVPAVPKGYSRRCPAIAEPIYSSCNLGYVAATPHKDPPLPNRGPNGVVP